MQLSTYSAKATEYYAKVNDCLSKASACYGKIRQGVLASGCFVGAMALVYRGNTFSPSDYTMVIPLMCVGTALALCATGLAIALRGNEQAQ
jgi:hypothetical protein